MLRFASRRLGFLATAILAATILVSLKAGELGVRIALGAGSEEPAASTEPATDTTAEPEVPPEPAEAAATNADGAAPAVRLEELTTEDLAILQQLSDRRAELDARARDLDTREQALLVVQRRVEDRIAELKALQVELEASVVRHDEVQEEQLKSLVKIYENMKPKDAAPIFDTLESSILLDVIERMKEAKVAPILALMNADRAREVTQDLARRRELPPTATN